MYSFDQFSQNRYEMCTAVAVPQMPYTGKRKMGYDSVVTGVSVVNPIGDRPYKRICTHSTSLNAVDALANAIDITKTTGQLSYMTVPSVENYLKSRLLPAIDELEHVVTDVDGQLENDIKDALDKAYQCEKFSKIHIADETQQALQVVHAIVAPSSPDTEYESTFEFDDDENNEKDEIEIDYEKVCGELDPLDPSDVSNTLYDEIITAMSYGCMSTNITINLPDWLHEDLWSNIFDDLSDYFSEVNIDFLHSSEFCAVFSVSM